MENIILTVTNFGAIIPTINYYNSGMYVKSFFILMSGLSSCMYHLIETKKHNMPGVSKYFDDNYWHHLFINFDRFFAVGSVILHLNSLIFNHTGLIFLALISVFMSEYASKYIYKHINISEKNIHVFFHSIWHLTVFELARLMSL